MLINIATASDNEYINGIDQKMCIDVETNGIPYYFYLWINNEAYIITDSNYGYKIKKAKE
jgi:hypothetical protein